MELAKYLDTHTLMQNVEFVIQRQVERYSAGFDEGYKIGLAEGQGYAS